MIDLTECIQFYEHLKERESVYTRLVATRLHMLNASSHTYMPYVFTVYMCIYVVFVGSSDSFRCARS